MAYADSNWSETRSTTGFVIMRLGPDEPEQSSIHTCVVYVPTHYQSQSVIAKCSMAIDRQSSPSRPGWAGTDPDGPDGPGRAGRTRTDPDGSD